MDCRLFCVCFLLRWKILSQGSWNFIHVQIWLINCIADCFVRHAWYALYVSFWRKRVLTGGSWIFKIVQICLINWIADRVVRYVKYALSVFFQERKFLLETVWNFGLKKSWSIKLQIVLCLFLFAMENSWSRQLEF